MMRASIRSAIEKLPLLLFKKLHVVLVLWMNRLTIEGVNNGLLGLVKELLPVLNTSCSSTDLDPNCTGGLRIGATRRKGMFLTSGCVGCFVGESGLFAQRGRWVVMRGCCPW